jgi:hypothetical protein
MKEQLQHKRQRIAQQHKAAESSADSAIDAQVDQWNEQQKELFVAQKGEEAHQRLQSRCIVQGEDKRDLLVH